MKIIVSLLILFAPISTFASIMITEIHPNPTGNDSGKEWIELYNTTQEPLQLNDWKINNESRDHLLTDTITPHSFKLIRFSGNFLNNTGGLITIKDSSNNTIEQLKYSQGPEGLSYSKIIEQEGNTQKIKWQWMEPTPENPNAATKTITGEIITPPQISTEFYFEILHQNQPHKIYIDDNKIKFDSIKATFRKSATIKATIDNESKLISYEILSLPKHKNIANSEKTSHLHFAIPLLFITILFLNHLKGIFQPPD